MITRIRTLIVSLLLLGAVLLSSGQAQLVSNGTYELTAQNSALALAGAGTINGSQVQQQTYTAAATQKWDLTNLGNNVVELALTGTSEALEVPGGTTTLGANLDVSNYTGATYQQWTIISVGSGYNEVVNVSSGLEANVSYNSTSSGALICQWTTGNYANGVWAITAAGGSAPLAPTGLTARSGNALVSLSWMASAGATSYNIYRGTSAGNESSLATGVSSTVYTDSTVINGVPYYYKVAAVNSYGTSTYSNEVSVTPTSSTNLIANGTYELTAQSSALALAGAGTVNGSQVQQQTYTAAATQKWDLTNLGNNVVELALTGTSEALEVPGGTTTLGANLDISSYTGATYQQWTIISVGSGYNEVVNVSSGLEANVSYNSTSSGALICQWTTGNYANGVWAITTASSGGAPLAPTGLTATASNALVSLSWTASTGATSYNIYRGTSAGNENSLATGVSSTAYSDSTVINGVSYYYKVAAVNNYGTSTYSNEVNATPATVATYALTVSNGTGSGSYAAGTHVTVTANAPQSGYQFSSWTGATSALANPTASTTTLTMPAAATSISATYTQISTGSASIVLAVGLERIVSGYNGPAIQIENSGGGVQDISFASGSNALNMASVSAFLGTSQGWITKLYDQSGHGNTVLAPTTSGTDNMPTISAVAPTSITNSGTTYLTARNVKQPYAGTDGNARYFILPASVSVNNAQASAFLAFRPDFSGSFNGYQSLYEIGDPTKAAFDLYTSGSGFQGLTRNANTVSGTTAVAFSPNNLYPRTQPTVVGLVTTPNSPATIYMDGVAHSAGGIAPPSATCSGGYLMAGTGTGFYYGTPLNALYNFLGFVVYNGTVDASTASSISNTMLPRTVPRINVVADGDSITQGTGSIYGWDTLRYTEPLLNQPVDLTNIAIYGSTSPSAISHISYPTATTSAVGMLYNSSYTTNIYYLAIGTNDIHGGFNTGAQTWANVQQCLLAAKAMGYKTIVATIMNEQDSFGNAKNPQEVNNFNLLVRTALANHAPYLDGVVDYNANSLLNPPTYYPTYSGDGTHPNDAGYQIMSGIATPVFNSLIGQ